MSNPFSTVRVEAKGKNRSYAALTDAEVRVLLAQADPRIGELLPGNRTVTEATI